MVTYYDKLTIFYVKDSGVKGNHLMLRAGLRNSGEKVQIPCERIFGHMFDLHTDHDEAVKAIRGADAVIEIKIEGTEADDYPD